MSSQFFPEPARWRGDLSARVPDAIRDGDLAARINAEHDACIGAAGRAVEHAIEAGRLLGEAKARVPHGAWMAWIEANCRFGRSTANNYMRVASNYQRAGNLEDEPESLRQALAMLAGPVKKKAALPSSRTPPGTSDEAGRKRSFARDVRRVIKECDETGEDVHDRMGFARVEGAEGLAARFVVADVRQLTGPESEPEPAPVPAPIRPWTGRVPESIAAIPESA